MRTRRPFFEHGMQNTSRLPIALASGATAVVPSTGARRGARMRRRGSHGRAERRRQPARGSPPAPLVISSLPRASWIAAGLTALRRRRRCRGFRCAAWSTAAAPRATDPRRRRGRRRAPADSLVLADLQVWADSPVRAPDPPTPVADAFVKARAENLIEPDPLRTVTSSTLRMRQPCGSPRAERGWWRLSFSGGSKSDETGIGK